MGIATYCNGDARTTGVEEGEMKKWLNHIKL